MTLAVPVLAVDYNPGVSVGQGAEYGNYVIDGQETDVNWTRFGVAAVSGKEVTLTELTEYMNGTDETVDKVYDVEAGTVDGQPASFPGTWIIAANLNEGDALPPVDLGYIVNTTETRTYLGVSRSVNIVSYSYSGEGYTISETFVYDKASGIMLEMEGKTVVGDTTQTYSDSITVTNIFEEAEPTPTPSEGIPVEYLYVGVIAVVIVIVVIAIALKKRSK
jgi:ABC-type Na+ efflux pump permease subunit